VLGTLVGEAAAASLHGLSDGERVLTALSVWPEYMRLLLFPLDLVADYGPAVIVTSRGATPEVVAGIGVIVGLTVLAWLMRERTPMVTLGIAWFVVTVLPVSNLIIPAGMLLAERTLYLPSVGLSIVVAGLVTRWAQPHRWVVRSRSVSARTRVVAPALALVVGALLFVRTVLRNPTWLDTYTVFNTLAVEHPESYVALRARGGGLARAGDVAGAREAYETAVALVPMHYAMLIEVAQFYGSRGQFGRAEELLVQAVRVSPGQAQAYRLLSEYMIRQSRGRDGHRIALTGLARYGPEPNLWALVSESYVAKGDLEGAARARIAALGQAPASSRDWGRLADIYQAMGRPEEAAEARRRQSASGPS
jgi:Flp pilus assembly protein TadD